MLVSPVCFQPPRQEQQHRQPSGEGRHGSLHPWLRHALPYGGAECCCAAWQTTAPLQRGSTRLLTGGAAWKTHTHKHTHWLLPTHDFTSDTEWAEPSNKTWQRSVLVCLGKFSRGSSPHAADLRYSAGLALLWQAVSSFTSIPSSLEPKLAENALLH